MQSKIPISQKCWHDGWLSWPLIGEHPVRQLAAVIKEKGLERSVNLTILTDISLNHLITGSTDLGSLLWIKNRIRNTNIYYVPKIHAKVYVSDDKLALIGSANFTDGGWFRNLECAVRLDDPSLVKQASHAIEQFACLGSPLSESHLNQLQVLVNELRASLAAECSSVDAKIREASETLVKQTEDELLRVKVANRTIHSIFSETIEYILKSGPLTTVEIHQLVRDFHPDLCDDSVDRVIDGQRYGKLWKHQVRTAQQHLKRTGRIAYDDASRRWHRLPTASTSPLAQ